jgi:hypothetical protein
MNSTPNPKQTDDPHDVLLVTPDVALVGPTEEELSRLAKMAQESAPKPSAAQTPAASGVAAGPTVPPVDTTFRPAAVGHIQPSLAKRAARAFTALLLAGCIGLGAVAWQINRDAAKRMITKWAPQFVTSSLSLEKQDLPAQPPAPAVQAAAASAAPAQPAAPNQTALNQAAPDQTAPQAVAPAAAAVPEPAQLLQSVARDVASLGQEVEQLKTSIEQLKASQQQMSRDIAKASEAKASEQKPRIAAAPPRPAAARPRRPVQPYYPPYPSPQAAASPAPPPAAAPYYAPRQDYAPRPVEAQPQIAAEPPADPDAASAPRPPMPVR